MTGGTSGGASRTWAQSTAPSSTRRRSRRIHLTSSTAKTSSVSDVLIRLQQKRRSSTGKILLNFSSGTSFFFVRILSPRALLRTPSAEDAIGSDESTPPRPASPADPPEPPDSPVLTTRKRVRQLLSSSDEEGSPADIVQPPAKKKKLTKEKMREKKMNDAVVLIKRLKPRARSVGAVVSGEKDILHWRTVGREEYKAPTQVKKPSPVQLLDSSDEESQDHLEPVTDTSKQRTQSKSEKAATVGVMKTSVKSSRAQKLLMDLLEESGRTEDVKKKGPIPRAGERRERHRSEGGARPGGKPERRFLEEEARLLDGYKTVKKRSNKIMSKDISTSIHFEGIKPKIPGKTKGRRVRWRDECGTSPLVEVREIAAENKGLKVREWREGRLRRQQSSQVEETRRVTKRHVEEPDPYYRDRKRSREDYRRSGGRDQPGQSYSRSGGGYERRPQEERSSGSSRMGGDQRGDQRGSHNSHGHSNSSHGHGNSSHGHGNSSHRHGDSSHGSHGHGGGGGGSGNAWAGKSGPAFGVGGSNNFSQVQGLEQDWPSRGGVSGNGGLAQQARPLLNIGGVPLNVRPFAAGLQQQFGGLPGPSGGQERYDQYRQPNNMMNQRRY